MKDANQALERKCPPRVNWTKEDQVVVDVEGRMMIRSKVELWKTHLQVADIGCNARAIIVGTPDAGDSCAGKVHRRNKLHSALKSQAGR